MINLLQHLSLKWQDQDHPFLIHSSGELFFSDIIARDSINLSSIKPGDVVALIGDFDPQSILTLLRLIELGAIVVPLTVETKSQHDYFFKSALVDVVIDGSVLTRRPHQSTHPLLEQLRRRNHAGLVLFSTGTTGRPKAILHDLSLFLRRFTTPRPTLRTINFLLFDHIGGLNTLFHTLFNSGTIVAPASRSVEAIMLACRQHKVEVLPTTPTFLRMMLISGLIPDAVPDSLRIITYGTERMDQPTLDALCELLPEIDFRQTFGMSELGIVRVKSEARDSLFMKVGGEGVATKVVDGVLNIQSETRMLGYLNAAQPFDEAGWYVTGDCVEEKDGYYRVVGRKNEVINVGGLKFMACEVERIALQYDGIEFAQAAGRPNPITGQHVELTVQVASQVDFRKRHLKAFMEQHLPLHMTPKRIISSSIEVGHRFKKV